MTESVVGQFEQHELQSNAFRTSVMHPWRLIVLGVIGLVAAPILFVASTH
jgi:hypothetical protein